MAQVTSPSPGVTITQVPDTTPPVATAASLTSASLAYSADSQFDGLTLTIDDPVAPVDEVGVFLVGFELTDAAGLTSFYGTPNGTPVPGGPLTLTITSS